ncbi:MAG TPA: sodium:solute symporter [Brevibacterium senegalense]|uniref:Sodium:solute symporter n=1 Tax=Brevibacterium senegalense TaxID=1033736 RepID=A0A921SNN3_9MICO|nr:sodium:solute symporter [Brevibacterium senegalense]
MDIAVVLLYLLAMIGFGVWGMRRARTQEDYLVAGRRLGPMLYTGTLAAVVLGGASTVGGVGLGYEFGLSGFWLVACIGLGILALSLFFAPKIQRLEIYTVSQMLELRYGRGSRTVSGLIMSAYGLMIATTSTVAYGSIFHALLGIDRVPAILLGGSVVVLYSLLGGMWSITITDFVQFIIQTIGIFLILLPIVLTQAGGFSGISAELGPDAFDPVAIGGSTILTYFLIYTLGLLIGQDIWQRVFTARSPGVARWGGVSAGLYCLLYAVAGALIGTAAQVLVPGIEVSDDVFTAVVDHSMAPLLAGFVLAAALSAVMSTASGGLIAGSTVFRQDVVENLTHRRGRPDSQQAAPQLGEVDESPGRLRASRLWLAAFGVVSMGLACVMPSVVEALTVAYNLLVAGLLIPILGGLVFRRGTIVGVLAGMIAGSVTTIVMMIVAGIFADSPIYMGLGASVVAYLVGSLVSRPTPQPVLEAWDARLRR